MLYEVYRFGTQIQDLREQVFLDVKKLFIDPSFVASVPGICMD